MQGFALIDERRDMHIPCTGHQRKTTQTGGFFVGDFVWLRELRKLR